MADRALELEDAKRHVFAQTPPVPFLCFSDATANITAASVGSPTTEKRLVGALVWTWNRMTPPYI